MRGGDGQSSRSAAVDEAHQRLRRVGDDGPERAVLGDEVAGDLAAAPQHQRPVGCCSTTFASSSRRAAPNRGASNRTTSSRSSAVSGPHSSRSAGLGLASPPANSITVVSPRSAKPIRSYTGPPAAEASSTGAQPWPAARREVLGDRRGDPLPLEARRGCDQADPAEPALRVGDAATGTDHRAVVFDHGQPVRLHGGEAVDAGAKRRHAVRLLHHRRPSRPASPARPPGRLVAASRRPIVVWHGCAQRPGTSPGR